MVGHTGVQSAIIEAMEAVDAACGQVVEAALAGGYAVLGHGRSRQLRTHG